MSVEQTIHTVFREKRRQILATVVRYLGDLDLAEEAIQEAFQAASAQWSSAGIPENPSAWLISTARFKGIDALRKSKRESEILGHNCTSHSAPEHNSAVPDFLNDDQLRLLFMCCHPSIAVEARVALSLREICGLSTDEVARCFLVTPETMKKRLSRAKSQLREVGLAFDIPTHSQLQRRINDVLHVIYLVYNEGYAATSGEQHIRTSLTNEALMLAKMLSEHLPSPEVFGLRSLLLFHESRTNARVDEHGDIVPLEHQDRGLWDQKRIAEATDSLQRVFMSGRVGSYAIEAAIASVHARAPSVKATNWALIVDYYSLLLDIKPGAVVKLQHAIAVAMRDGPEAGLALIAPLVERGKPLQRYHLAHAARADLAERANQLQLAETSIEIALSLARQAPEVRYLRRKAEAIRKKNQG